MSFSELIGLSCWHSDPWSRGEDKGMLVSEGEYSQGVCALRHMPCQIKTNTLKQRQIQKRLGQRQKLNFGIQRRISSRGLRSATHARPDIGGGFEGFSLEFITASIQCWTRCGWKLRRPRHTLNLKDPRWYTRQKNGKVSKCFFGDVWQLWPKSAHPQFVQLWKMKNEFHFTGWRKIYFEELYFYFHFVEMYNIWMVDVRGQNYY